MNIALKLFIGLGAVGAAASWIAANIGALQEGGIIAAVIITLDVWIALGVTALIIEEKRR